MNLGWMAVIGVFLMLAGLCTLAYDGLRRRRGNNPYPFPDAATNQLRDTALQTILPAQARRPKLARRFAPPGLYPLVSRIGQSVRPVPLLPRIRNGRSTFLVRFLLAIPRRAIVLIVIGSLALIATSLLLLAGSQTSAHTGASSVTILVGPFVGEPDGQQMEDALATYIAQSAGAGGINSLVFSSKFQVPSYFNSKPGTWNLEPGTQSGTVSMDDALKRSDADFAIWGSADPDGVFTANITLSPGFAAQQLPWQLLNDPDLDALILPDESSITFKAGAATDPLVPLAIALADFKLGKSKEAADAAWGAQETLNQAGDNGQFARLLEAEARLASGDYNGAATAVDDISHYEPASDDTLLVSALARFYLNEYEEAMSLAAQVIGDRGASDAQLADAYLVRARARAATGDMVDASSDLDESARLNPSGLRAHLEKADLLYKQARPGEASAELARVINQANAAAPPYKLMGLVRLMSGQPQDALTSLDTSYSLYFRWIGELRAQEAQASALGDSTQAQEATDGVLKLNSDLAEVAMYEGIAWGDIAKSEPKESFLAGLWRGIRGEPTDWDRALSKLQEALRLDPQRPDVPLQIGTIYAQQGDYPDAARWLQQAQSLDPSLPEPYMALAQVKVAQKDFDGAASTLRELLSSAPGYYPAYDLLHTVYVTAGDNESAEAALEEALSVAPQSPSDHLWHGKFLVMLDRASEAEQELRLATEDPQQWEAHLLLGKLLEDSGRGPEALGEFQALLALQPDNPTALLEASKLLVLAGKQDDAETLLRRLTGVAPDNVDGHLALLQLLLSKGENSQAMDEGRRAVSIADSRSDAHYYLALTYEAAGDWHDASTEYGAATQRDPKNFQAFVSLSKSLFMEDRYQESVAAAASALQLRSDLPDPYRWKAESQLALGETNDALSTLGALSSSSANNADTLALTARAYAAGGDLDSAISYAQQAIDAGPNNSAGALALGDIYLQEGNAQAAMSSYQSVETMGDKRSQALSLAAEGRAFYALGSSSQALEKYNEAEQRDPTAGEPFLYMGNLYAASGSWDNAFQAYHHAVELRPNWPLALYYLGEAYLQRKDLQNAQAAFAKATTFSPNMVVAWYGLGIAERAEGDSNGAITALSKATQLNGNYAEAWLYLGLSYEEAGRPFEASAAFTQAKNTATDPEIASQAEQGLARLR